jgi:two-component system KDP operon response regulator KdpE
MLRPVILIVEDESPMRRVLSVALRGQGYDTDEAENAAAGLAALSLRTPQAILMDIGLPDVDGVTLTSRIRRITGVPIVVISARSEERQQISALDAGANDYVVKPFREGELLARIRAAIRSAQGSEDREGPYRIGPLRVEPDNHLAFLEGVELNLTRTEFRLLRTLARQAGRVVTREALLREVWGAEHVEAVHYLRVYVRQLRQKIEADAARPALLVTAPGVGYRLKVPAA